MKKINLSLKRIAVKNVRDIDVCIRDAFGTEHRIFPKEKKRLIMLTKGEDDDTS